MHYLLVALLITFSHSTLSAQTLPAASSKTTKQESPTEPKQKSPAENQVVVLPLARQNFKPKLTLQSALKLAESYIEKEKIDISSFYLFQAKFIAYGDKGNKEPAWHFWWVNQNGALGNYVEILVMIDTGSVGRLPSM